MNGLQQFAAFAETAKHGGFAAAARVLGTAPSTVAKAVARLETSLGIKLFHRTTRQVTLTPDGERLFERCQRVLTEVEDLQADAAGTRAIPSGTVRIALPVFYGRRFVLPILGGLTRRHPALRFDLRLSDQQVDLVGSGIDLAVRIGPLRDSSLIARRVDSQALVLCASTAYLALRGTPRRIDDLRQHDAIAFRLPTSGRDRPWQFRQRARAIEFAPEAKLRISDTESLADAARQGLGVCQLPRMLVHDDLADGGLVELLPGLRPANMPIQLVYPSGRLLPARVRATLDALEALRQRQPAG